MEEDNDGDEEGKEEGKKEEVAVEEEEGYEEDEDKDEDKEDVGYMYRLCREYVRKAVVQGRDNSVPQKARSDIHTSSLSLTIPSGRKVEDVSCIIPLGIGF